MTNNHIENNAARAVAAHRYVVFSVKSVDRPAVIRSMNRYKVQFKMVHGNYKGKEELSFIVNAGSWPDVYKAAAWSIQTQESILHLGPVDRVQDARPVILEYMSIGGLSAHRKPPEFLGYWFAVSRETALARDAWTRDNGQHYVAAMKRPEHIPAPNSDAAHRRALYASNDSVRASNRLAIAASGVVARRRVLAGNAAPNSDAAHRRAVYAGDWSGYECPVDPANYWIDDVTGERVCTRTGRRTVAGHFTPDGKARTPSGHEF